MSTRTVERRLLCAVAVLTLSACEPGYTGVELTLVTSPPLEVELGDEVKIPEGVVAAVHVEAFNADGAYAAKTALTLSSRDSSILGVASTVEPKTFVLIGASVGKTCIVVRIDGEEEECLTARVTNR